MARGRGKSPENSGGGRNMPIPITGLWGKAEKKNQEGDKCVVIFHLWALVWRVRRVRYTERRELFLLTV